MLITVGRWRGIDGNMLGGILVVMGEVYEKVR